jgi:hypothetical protein
MKLQKAILYTFVAVGAGWVPQCAQAASLRIPSLVYPSGAHIGYRPVLTNAEVDCMWGFTCEGGYVPNFHFSGQDELHRLRGWGQFAGIQHRGRTTMAFELFVSRYDQIPDESGTPWSERAFLDLQTALLAQGYVRDGRDEALLPSARTGGVLVAVQYLGRQDLVVMARWSGNLEIEAIALYDHRPPAARQTARTSLALQIRLASNRGSA